MLTKAKVQISSIYFLGYIWFSRLLSVAKFRILHGIYQWSAMERSQGAGAIVGRENQQKAFTDINLL